MLAFLGNEHFSLPTLHMEQPPELEESVLQLRPLKSVVLNTKVTRIDRSYNPSQAKNQFEKSLPNENLPAPNTKETKKVFPLVFLLYLASGKFSIPISISFTIHPLEKFS